jgi:hypothetical protein
MTDADRFRETEACRAMAGKVISQLDQEAWLILAEDWLKMANLAEKREGSTSPKR